MKKMFLTLAVVSAFAFSNLEKPAQLEEILDCGPNATAISSSCNPQGSC